MRLPQDRILHIDTEFKNDKVNIIAEWQGELVRCKDCKHYSVEGKTTQFGWCNALEMPTDEQRFCADGERSEK